MELFVNLGCQLPCERQRCSSCPGRGQQQWEGSSLGNACWGEREFCANSVPGGVSSQGKPKPQLAQCLLFNEGDFFLLFLLI